MDKKRGLDRVISKHTQPHQDISFSTLPPGIKVLVYYTGIIAFFYLLYIVFASIKPVYVIFGSSIYGNAALVIELISFVLLLSIIYGLSKRHYWVFWISLIWFSLGVLDAIVSLLTFSSQFDVLRQILVISSLIITLLNGIVVWYVYSEKHYFKVKHLDKKTKQKDKFFIYVISTVIIFSLLLLITFGLNFYSTTITKTHTIITELKNSTYPEITCGQKMGDDKDICYLVLTIMYNDTQRNLCDNIQSDFYKMTCDRAIG